MVKKSTISVHTHVCNKMPCQLDFQSVLLHVRYMLLSVCHTGPLFHLYLLLKLNQGKTWYSCTFSLVVYNESKIDAILWLLLGSVDQGTLLPN